ncbi:hypothetical protein HYZ99_05660 [Candidatus Peregrinibacteria bacterium]|nr:hypothetical protein [Candidatus Peregrinibacteria bacterium]
MTNSMQKDEAFELAFETKQRVRDAHERFDEEIERVLSTLKLPLTNSLNVPEEQVAVKSQEILETLIRLREARDQILDETDHAIDEYVNRFPEEERDEIRAKMQVIGMLS